MQLNSEVPGPSGRWIHHEPISVVSKVEVLTGNKVNNNISVQTGEEFSRQFLQDRRTPTKVAAIPDTPQNHELKVGFNKNQNSHMGYEEITRILGLKRMDSECGSDISEFASAKGSTAEVENGAYIDLVCAYNKENSDYGYGPRRVTGEVNYDPAAIRPSAPPINELESFQSSQPYGLVVLDGSQSGKMKFLCSFGGKILPRPSDGKLRYVGGDTRIISLRKNLSREELVKKTSGICNQPHTIKYQLPGEDLDALISVSSDEDLQNMIEEYQGQEKLGGSQRLRIFLIPLSESESKCPLDDNTIIQQSNPDYQYVVAVNGIFDPSPRRNSEQLLATDVIQLKTNLKTKDILGDSYSTQYVNEFQNLVSSSIQYPPFSPLPGQQGDSNGVHTQLYKDSLFSGSTESCTLFSTAQLPPENSASDAASYYHPTHGAVTSMNCYVPNKIEDIRQPSKPGGLEFHNHIPSREFVVPPSFDRNDTDADKYSFERPMLKERTFHSEKPVSHSGDPIGLLSGSNESIGSQHRMPHAFSDSQLKEHGERSAYCSQERMSPSSPLNFSKPQLSSEVVSVALQENALQLPENIDLVRPQVQIKLQNVEPTVSHRRMDILNCSLGSVSLSRNEYTQEDADDKFQSTKDVKRNNFIIQNLNEENPQSSEILNASDDKDPLLHWVEKLSKSRPPSLAMEYMNKSPSINYDPISILSANTPSQDLQVSGGMVPTSAGIDLEHFVETMMVQPQSIQLEKAPAELSFNGQGTAKDQQHVLTVVMGGERGSDTSQANNLEVAGMFPGFKQQPRDENSPSDVPWGLKDVLVCHESSGACQNNMGFQEPILVSSADLCPSAVCDNAGMDANLHNLPAMQNPAKKSGFRREVSLIDDDFVNYTNQTVAKSGILGCANEKQIPEYVSLNNHNEQNQLDSMVTVEQVADTAFPGVEFSSATIPLAVDATVDEIISSGVTEPDSILPESDYENGKADDGDKDESISDAMIAEMEADIYGLQIIKNADLEELWELGSGTYGTVYHGKWRGTDVAIKRIKNSCFVGRSSEQERLIKDFWREAQILSNLHHPNVLAFYGVVPDGAGGTLATVTEFMANGSLRNVLLKKDRSLDRHRKLTISMDAAFGMEYLHSKNIVHFDLKCDNLLVNLRDPQRPICKVGDFGLSRIKRNTLVSGGVRGTLPWMAPELLNGSSNRVSEKVDVFSFGITMWEILTGEEPYANMHCGAIIGGILKDTLRPPIPERCDPEWRTLMEQCWSTDPEARPSFTEVTNRLRSMSIAVQAKGQNNVARQTKPGIPV
ncbi:putative serine/threonine-protein kinase SIS8 [Camellia lanceoleosa]|uniref:Serine/threonine-protein kinase SIS8 n=1 Tax=Camellia lanceoleosa TaxID=1840588 RepID=A0ACC0HHW6_9ERIC|nr:putative serine/threonine-protein kinase SIS8 [Camellia lanceoleosa]